MVTVMTDAAGARVVTRTGQPLVLPDIDRERVAAALPDPARAGEPRTAGRRVRRHRAAGGAGPDAGRARPLHRQGARPAHPGRDRHGDRDRPPGGPGAAPCPALQPAARPRRRPATQHAHRAAGARPLRDRRPLRARRRGRRDRWRLVRRLPPGGRRDGARHRRRRGPRHARGRRHGAGARPAARDRVLQRRHAGRDPHRAGPSRPGARPRHDGHRPRRPPRGERRGPPRRPDVVPLVQRRAPAARS